MKTELYERNHHTEILYAPDSIQGIPEENSSPAAWTDGSLQLWDSKCLSKFGQRNPLLGGEWEIKKTAGLTAAKTKIPLHQSQHNIPWFSIVLTKLMHLES